MEEEIEKQKYRDLKLKLKDIKKQIGDLNEFYDDLENIMRKSILVDNHNIDNDLLEKLRRQNNFIFNELSNSVIPMVDSNC